MHMYGSEILTSGSVTLKVKSHWRSEAHNTCTVSHNNQTVDVFVLFLLLVKLGWGAGKALEYSRI